MNEGITTDGKHITHYFLKIPKIERRRGFIYPSSEEVLFASHEDKEIHSLSTKNLKYF